MSEKFKPDSDLIARYLAGEASENEQSGMSEWLDDKPENREELARLHSAWTLSGNEKLIQLINDDSAWLGVKARVVRLNTLEPIAKNKWILNSRFLKMAAGILLLAAIASGLYLITSKLHSTSSLISVSNDEPNALLVNLPDGSQVSLNKGARLEYQEKLSQTFREVTLTGEAFFEVKPDPTKPFIVHTQNASIKVVGTSFNVSAYSHTNLVNVIVESGKVELQPSNPAVQGILLEKGNTGTYSKNELRAVKGNNTDINYLSWKTRLIRFESTPLSQVVSVLNKTYHTDIDLSVDDLKKCKFTGTFSEETLDTVIKVLQTAFNLKIDTKDKRIQLSGKGC